MRHLLCFVLLGFALAPTGTGQGTTALVSQTPAGLPAGSGCVDPEISTDGRWVVFTSSATDLVAGDVNGVSDVFLRDLQSASTEIVSLTSSGAQADGGSGLPSVSADGSRICGRDRRGLHQQFTRPGGG